MKLLAFEWAQNRTMKVNSRVKLQSWKVAFSIVVLKVSFDSPPRSERVKYKFALRRFLQYIFI